MERAHDLARYAAMCADYIDLEQIESWNVETSFIPDRVRVTLRLYGKRSRTYMVELEKERDTPAGESPPGSPQE